VNLAIALFCSSARCGLSLIQSKKGLPSNTIAAGSPVRTVSGLVEVAGDVPEGIGRAVGECPPEVGDLDRVTGRAEHPDLRQEADDPPEASASAPTAVAMSPTSRGPSSRAVATPSSATAKRTWDTWNPVAAHASSPPGAVRRRPRLFLMFNRESSSVLYAHRAARSGSVGRAPRSTTADRRTETSALLRPTALVRANRYRPGPRVEAETVKA
jgi:hypothetical protein